MIQNLFSTIVLTSLMVFGYWWERKQDPSQNLPLWIEIPRASSLMFCCSLPSLHCGTLGGIREAGVMVVVTGMGMISY